MDNQNKSGLSTHEIISAAQLTIKSWLFFLEKQSELFLQLVFYEQLWWNCYNLVLLEGNPEIPFSLWWDYYLTFMYYIS